MFVVRKDAPNLWVLFFKLRGVAAVIYRLENPSRSGDGRFCCFGQSGNSVRRRQPLFSVQRDSVKSWILKSSLGPGGSEPHRVNSALKTHCLMQRVAVECISLVWYFDSASSEGACSALSRSLLSLDCEGPLAVTELILRGGGFSLSLVNLLAPLLSCDVIISLRYSLVRYDMPRGVVGSRAQLRFAIQEPAARAKSCLYTQSPASETWSCLCSFLPFVAPSKDAGLCHPH